MTRMAFIGTNRSRRRRRLAYIGLGDSEQRTAFGCTVGLVLNIAGGEAAPRYDYLHCVVDQYLASGVPLLRRSRWGRFGEQGSNDHSYDLHVTKRLQFIDLDSQCQTPFVRRNCHNIGSFHCGKPSSAHGHPLRLCRGICLVPTSWDSQAGTESVESPELCFPADCCPLLASCGEVQGLQRMTSRKEATR